MNVTYPGRPMILPTLGAFIYSKNEGTMRVYNNAEHVNNQGEIVASVNNAIEKMQERSVLKIKVILNNT